MLIAREILVTSQRDDLSFQNPVGVCLARAPRIDAELFVGRGPELSEMGAVLKPRNSPPAQRRLVLGGLGGMGKTQLAVAFGTRHYQEDSSVFWLDASSEDAVKDSFRILAEAIFDVRDRTILANEQSIVHTKRWLSDKRNTRWLMIFDNYDDPESYRVERYFPDALHGSIIITTRRPELVAGYPIRLQPLQQIEEQLKILETRSARENVKSGKFFDNFGSGILIAKKIRMHGDWLTASEDFLWLWLLRVHISAEAPSRSSDTSRNTSRVGTSTTTGQRSFQSTSVHYTPRGKSHTNVSNVRTARRPGCLAC
jgi:hypothetical protein